MSESPDINSIPRDECDCRCKSEGLVWLETEKSAILLCGHHMRALFIDPVTKRMKVIDVEAYWKHTGMPFTEETFWGPDVEFDDEDPEDADADEEVADEPEENEETEEEEGEA